MANEHTKSAQSANAVITNQFNSRQQRGAQNKTPWQRPEPDQPQGRSSPTFKLDSASAVGFLESMASGISRAMSRSSVSSQGQA